MRKNYRSLHQLEGEVRSHMSALVNAKDEAAAAKAYRALGHSLDAYLAKAKEINSERWKVRETALKQAQLLSEFELSEITGVGERPTEQHFNFPQPETLTVQNSPDFHFIRLSFGLLNVRQIVLLDVKSKTLHTTSGTHHLSAGDTRLLIAQLKLYPAPEITEGIPLRPTEQHKANQK